MDIVRAEVKTRERARELFILAAEILGVAALNTGTVWDVCSSDFAPEVLH